MDIYLHEKQSIIDEDDHRFQVVAAGRRFGKSFYAAYRLYEAASHTTKIRSDGSEVSLMNDVVYYVGPTFKQARENLWQVMMDMGGGVGGGLITGVRQNEGEITLANGRIIRFKGADDPDSLRGVGVSFVVMDEYAFMKPSVWEFIIRPMLMLSEGGALFIGTPAGKNHFYKMWLAAMKGVDPMTGNPSKDWKAFQFKSADNPHYTAAEIESIVSNLSEDARKQELEASFEATGGKVFNAGMFPIVHLNPRTEGGYVIAVDIAGFSNVEGARSAKQILDDTAIAVAKVHDKGWHIERIYHGQWDVRGTALRIIKAWRDHGSPPVGIERGIGKNAVCGEDGQSGPLEDYMQQWGYFTVIPLTHGNQRKEDRIKWALQGRAEKGQITLEPDDDLPAEEKWVGKFLSQAVDFPNHLAHDDLLDAVAYIDQLADKATLIDINNLDTTEWIPQDLEVGF